MPTEPGHFLLHRIRLRGPWDFEWSSPPSDTATNDSNGTLRLPTTWNDAFGGSNGTVRLSRRFNRPTGIDDGERVWIELDVSRPSLVSFNEMRVGRIEPGIARFDVTDRVTIHNRIALEIDGTASVEEDRSIVEVVLVIESAE
ncbi:MAG: hypothetical protein WBC44_01255 [Planctomycetaceae bacterium]